MTTFNSNMSASEGKTVEHVVVDIVNYIKRTAVTSVTDITDSAGGSAPAAGTVLPIPKAIVATTVSGSNLATAATVNSAITTVKNALAELYAKANAYATPLGYATVTYSGGGVATDGTIDTVTVSTTGAGTGPSAESVNVLLAQLNGEFVRLVNQVNKFANETGFKKIPTGYVTQFVASTAINTVADQAAGVAGASKADVDAALTSYRTCIKLIAAKLNELNTSVPLNVVLS